MTSHLTSFTFEAPVHGSVIGFMDELPESVGFEGGIGVDVVMQPPLHCHVPVAHAMADLHTEVCVVAVNVLDGFEVVFLFI